MTGDHPGRWAWAEIDRDALAHNVRVLRAASAPADVWAVVKADGYGHGAVVAAETAIQAGAAGLCVALVDEGLRLRAAGIDAPILLLSEQPQDRIPDLIAHRLTPTVYTPAFVDALVDHTDEPIAVHVNVDTGMQRVGVRHDDLTALAERLVAAAVVVDGVYTHLACADEPAAQVWPAGRVDQRTGRARKSSGDISTSGQAL